MREVVRDPEQDFSCPRCGEPVTYKGRGRRPIWCSARCRVEASIERRGNEIVGVKPEIVRVVSPAARLSEWEKDQRQKIERTLARDTIVAMVASQPGLLLRALARIEEEGVNTSDDARQILAEGMIQTARSISPEAAYSATTSTQRSHKRDAAEWVDLLDELTTQLATGLLYNRDLPALNEPIRNLASHYLRRVDSSH